MLFVDERCGRCSGRKETGRKAEVEKDCWLRQNYWESGIGVESNTWHKAHSCKPFLPPSYEVVRGKVLFSQVSVHIWGGGGYPSSWRGGGTPSQVQVGGSLSSQPEGGCTPSQVQVEGIPSSQQGGGGGTPSIPGPGRGVPHPRSRWRGVPPSRTKWGNPPPPPMPPPPAVRRQQHSEHLLRDGRYASCVHAGWLSCFSI